MRHTFPIVEGKHGRPPVISSEKCVAHSGSEDDKIRMIPARFARVLPWSARHLAIHFLLIFQ
jgi:hypothetical protein